VTGGKIAYAHSIQRFTGADKSGKKVEMAFRMTDCLEKEDGRWKIVHEHKFHADRLRFRSGFSECRALKENFSLVQP